jgi:hypothetical protein
MTSLAKEPAVDVDILAEKNALPLAVAESDVTTIVKDWSDNEEKKLKLK